MQEDALAEATGTTEQADGEAGDEAALLDLGLGKKKKKKKAKARLWLASMQVRVHQAAQGLGLAAAPRLLPLLRVRTAARGRERGTCAQARADDDFSLDTEEQAEGEDAAEDGATNGTGLPWDGSDRDYIYEELLGARPRPGLRGRGSFVAAAGRLTPARPQTACSASSRRTTRADRRETSDGGQAAPGERPPPNDLN